MSGISPRVPVAKPAATSPVKPATKPAAKPEVKAETKPVDAPSIKKCLCGCGGNVPSKSNYKMGHDARHAGVVGRQAGQLKVDGDKDWQSPLKALPTSPLQTKALTVAINTAERVLAKLEREEAKAKAQTKNGAKDKASK